MSALHIDVSVYGGSDIESACCAACVLSNQLAINVHFQFNGVTMIARPDSGGLALAQAWNDAVKNKRSVASAPLTQGEATAAPLPSSRLNAITQSE